MKSNNMARNKGQVYSIGNYLMTGRILGKGHFARVEEATHRIIGKKVAIKVIDLTCIKEEYARRNLHREPRVMARLRHPCIAALYETMMHGPRLYVVMEAAGGGDLCAHVLGTRGAARGLPESRAKALAAQLVSAVRHMHARGVVHRDLKMENIMLDSTKQFIKIVDFGLSNLWAAGGALRTPCGSLEYAAPELFVDGRRYGPEVDLWSIGVIVYGMVTGGLPFTSTDAGGEGRSRPQLRAAIAKGFTRKQRGALACVSGECKTFIQHLLEPNVDLRMKIEEASRHRWVRRANMRMKTHPLATVDCKVNREIFRQIAELSGQNVVDVIAQVKSDPFGTVAGMYNIKTHLHQMQAVPGVDLLWSSANQETRSQSPPEYIPYYEVDRPDTAPTHSKSLTPPITTDQKIQSTNGLAQKSYAPNQRPQLTNGIQKPLTVPKTPQMANGTLKAPSLNGFTQKREQTNGPIRSLVTSSAAQTRIAPLTSGLRAQIRPDAKPKVTPSQSPRLSLLNKPVTRSFCMKNPIYKSLNDSGDCGLDPRLPIIDEHSNLDQSDGTKLRTVRSKPVTRTTCLRKIFVEEDQHLRLNSCPTTTSEAKRTEFYRRAGDGIPSWKASGVPTPPARLLLQSNATTIKRASLGNIVSPHSSTNSHCKSDRAMPVGWYNTRTPVGKEPPHLQRFRRTVPMK